MKKVLIICSLILFVLIGCSNDEAYNNAIEKGLDYIASEDYQKAESAFELALDEKTDDEKASNLLKQTISYQEAKKAFEDSDFELAERKSNEVIKLEDYSSALAKKAGSILKSISDLESTLADIESDYEDASKLYEEKNYKKAGKTAESILDKDLKHSIFKSVKEDTEKLQENITSVIEENKKADQKQEEEALKEAEKEKEAVKQEEKSSQKLPEGEMRNIAKQYVDNWNGYDNPLNEEYWDDDKIWKYYIFQDGPTQHIIGVKVHSETGEVQGDYGGID